MIKDQVLNGKLLAWRAFNLEMAQRKLPELNFGEFNEVWRHAVRMAVAEVKDRRRLAVGRALRRLEVTIHG
jgi:hypothetical protein